MHPNRIRDAVAAIAAGTTSSSALLGIARERAEAEANLNAIAHVDWNAAAAQATAMDDEARSGRLRGPLHGIPVTIKDLFNVRGMPTRAGTKAPLPELGADEAELVARLRGAGALIFAKTNMHEVALGATGENRWTGDVCNPRDPARQAGGSSSGAGVAVATGIGMAAVGSDTGGSIRVPAAFCGVVGFKPTYGAIPLAGALYLSWTCDHAGPLARCVDDAALMFEVMARRRTDHGAVPRAPRLAVPSAWLAPRLSDAVRERFDRTIALLRGRGAVIASVATPMLDEAWAVYTPIVRAESAYVHRAALASGGEGFSEGVLAPMQQGGRLSALQYIDAMRRRETVRAALGALLDGFDALVLPTSPVVPPLRGQLEVEVADGQRMPIREAVLGQTAAFSLVGVPTLSLPMGDAGGLPTGLQIVGATDADARVLALGRWIESSIAA